MACSFGTACSNEGNSGAGYSRRRCQHGEKYWMMDEVMATMSIWQNGKCSRPNSLERVARFWSVFWHHEVRKSFISQNTYQGQKGHFWWSVMFLRASTALWFFFFEDHFLNSWVSLWLEQKNGGRLCTEMMLGGKKDSYGEEKILVILW